MDQKWLESAWPHYLQICTSTAVGRIPVLRLWPSAELCCPASRAARLALDLEGTGGRWDGCRAAPVGAQGSVPCAGTDLLLALATPGCTEVHLPVVWGTDTSLSRRRRSEVQQQKDSSSVL